MTLYLNGMWKGACAFGQYYYDKYMNINTRNSLRICKDWYTCRKVAAAYLGGASIPYFLLYIKNPN